MKRSAVFLVLALSLITAYTRPRPDNTSAVSFTLARVYGTAGLPVFAAVGDFNGDGKLDVVTANDVSTISVWLGNGDGNFQVAQTTTAGSSPVSIAPGDFNHDGKLDVAVANLLVVDSNSPFLGRGYLSILLGNGDGTFQSPTNYAAGDYCSSVAAGDFNDDGNLDLAVSSITTLEGLRYPGSVAILLGNGDGTFHAGGSYETGEDPASIIVCQLNHDREADLAVANDDGTLMVFLGRGNGTFTVAASYRSAGRPASIAAADFNRDGATDLAVLNFSTADVSIFVGQRNGKLRITGTYPVGGSTCFSIATDDFDGDGRPDLAVADYGGSTVPVLLGNRDGTFRTATNVVTAPNPQGIATGDFDGDGRPDLALANPDSSISILLNTTGDPYYTLKRQLDELVPCGGPWKTHSEYVRAFERAAEDFVQAGLLTVSEKRVLVRQAAESDCGRPQQRDRATSGRHRTVED